MTVCAGGSERGALDELQRANQPREDAGVPATEPTNACMQLKAAPQKVTRPEGALRHARTPALRRRHA